MASRRRNLSKGSPKDSSTPPHDDQLDAEDMTGVGLFLLARRESGAVISEPEDLFPAYSMEDVYGIHSALTATSSTLGHHVGWKCGACSPAAQAAFNISEPFRAPLFKDRIFTEQRTAVDTAKVNLTILEAEFGFVLSKSLPPRGGKKYTAAEVMAAVSVILPAVEVCASRWSGEALAQSTPFHRLADGGGNESCVVGDATEASDGLMESLDSVGVRFLINGEPAVEGSGANVLDHPANSLAWLANTLIDGNVSTESSKYGGGALIGLQEGDFVMSGAAAVLPAADVSVGDVVVAEFEGFGSVELLITETAATGGLGGGGARAAQMGNDEWRELCVEARAGGAKVAMIFPWNPAREASVREMLGQAPKL